MKFPILSPGEVAILRAEYATGHILDESLKIAINDGQTVFTVVNSIDKALQIVKDLIKGNEELECVIYDEKEKMLFYINKGNVREL